MNYITKLYNKFRFLKISLIFSLNLLYDSKLFRVLMSSDSPIGEYKSAIES